MKLKYLTMLIIMFAINMNLYSQAQRNCGAMENLEFRKSQDDKITHTMKAIESHTNAFVNNTERAVNGIVTIPTVVHVIYSNANENISNAQIQSQIDVLNLDFRLLNTDANNTWTQNADSEIEFCLASVDPNGNATTGITRKSSSTSSWVTNDAMKFSSNGGVDAWPTGDYLNIWVCNIGGGILGYAQFPGGASNTDGVVVGPNYFGTTGYLSSPFDLGRTTTHEIGHWLNLRHIWGDGGCGVDDFVSDTPTSDASNTGCATGHVSCGTTDMVQNYMDYSDDACMNLFTEGQKTRMRAQFDTGGFRASILNSGGCGNGGPGATCSDGIQNQGETGVDCGGPCTPCSTACSENEVVISITFDNYPEETSWSITNGGGATVASGGTYGSQADGSTLTITECLADGCYDFTINDAYGDGICCSYGNGSYTVSSGGSTVASGGSFTSSETTNFCLGGGPAATCNDGIQNQGETGVDCGGPCTACATCNDGIQNQGETGVDCGGPCTACPTCNDGVQNQGETDVDCGGPCTACPTCNDGIQNQGETGVDCGGPCTPCSSGCTANEVNVTITFDNYPEETSWTIVNSNGATVASGGTYASQADGSTLTITECLADGCYDFTINDAYGDGICCSYGNGSYSVSSGGSTLVSGSTFASSATSNFCLGGGPAATCNDGIQNQGETGVDCGGPCTPCGGGGSCTQVNVNFESFESGWGIWNDGGSDCARINYAPYATTGSMSIRIRDNSGAASSMTTDNMSLNGFEEVQIDFNYYPVGMESGEDFFLEGSLDGGSSWTIVGTWARPADFQNNSSYFESVVVTGDFNNTTQWRFRCDASANNDRIYIDDVNISGCANANREIEPGEIVGDIVEIESVLVDDELSISEMQVYPNPTTDLLNVDYQLSADSEIILVIHDVNGKVISNEIHRATKGQQKLKVDASEYDAGFYFISLQAGDEIITKRFIAIK